MDYHSRKYYPFKDDKKGMQKHDVESASVIKYDDRGVKEMNVIFLQIVEEKVVDDYKDRSQSDIFHIPVNDEKRERDKDVKMHLQTAKTLLYQDNRIGKQYKGYNIPEKLASAIVPVRI